MKECLKKIMENFRFKLSNFSKIMMVLATFVLSMNLVNAKTVYVDFSKADDYADGLTWANAKKNIQAGVNVAVAGDEVWVAKGTYNFVNAANSFDYGIDVSGKAIKIYGGLSSGAANISSRENSDRSIILRATGQTGFRIITFRTNTSGSTVFDGFELNGANINIGSLNGGAIGVWSSGVLINNCVIKNATTEAKGGGIFSANSITITNCRIGGNQTTDVSTHPASAGGIQCAVAGSIINNCLIDNNTGTGVSAVTGIMTLMNCTIVKNKAVINAEGGVSTGAGSDVKMTNCIIWGNEKSTQGLGQVGSGATTGRNNNASGFGAVTNCAFSWSGVTGIPNTWNNSISLTPGTTGTASDTAISTILQPFKSPSTNAGHGGYNNSADWNLTTNSACLGKGSSTIAGYPLVDIDRKLRPIPPSIGAFEPVAAIGTWYVDASKTDDSGDGLSWATAKKTLPSAIMLASAGEKICMANGVYPSSTVTISKSNLTIQGGWSLIVPAKPVHQVFQAGTIFNGGNAEVFDLQTGAEGVIFEGLTFRNYAGSDFIIKTVPINLTMKSCFFTNNTKTGTSQAGLIIQPTLSTANKRLLFSGCSFINNNTRSGCFLITGNAPTSGYDFENCVFANNSGGLSSDGSVITLTGISGCSSTMKNCTFVNNFGAAGASSIRKNNASALTIINTVFFSTDLTKPQIVSANSAGFFITNCYITAETGKIAGGVVSGANFGTVSNSLYLATNNPNSPGFVSVIGKAGNNNGNIADNFSLMSTSALMAAGTASGAPTVDIVNVERTNPPSVGAYQGSYNPAETGGKIFVHGSNGNDANDGRTWATAKSTIEGALLLSPSEIWVTVGNYAGAGTGNAYIIASGVKMYGGFSGNELSIADRSIGNFSTLNKKTTAANTRILRLEAGLNNSSRTIVDGFKITGGSLTVDLMGEANVGAGVFMNNFTTLSNCIVEQNTAITGGGGIYMKEDSLVDMCVIESNRLSGGAGFFFGNSIACGGGVLMNSTSATIRNSSILKNSNPNSRDGGGIVSINGNIINCIISGNNTPRNGGGIYASGKTNIVNCLINDNQANSEGGGIKIYGTGNPTVKIINCTIVKNTSTGEGSGVSSGGTNTSASNTVFWGNLPADKQWKGTGTRTNCASNDSTAISSSSTNIVLSATNEDINPLGPFFKDPSANNYQLEDQSPLRNTGNDALYTIGNLTEDKDLSGNSRKISTSIDIGAYESTSNTKRTYIPIFSSRVLPKNSPAFTITNLPLDATVQYSIDNLNFGQTFPQSAGRYLVRVTILSSEIYEDGNYDNDFWLVEETAHISPNGGLSYGAGTGWNYAINKDLIVDTLNAIGYKTLWVAAGEYNITKRIVGNFTGKTLIGGFLGNETSITNRAKTSGGKSWEFVNPTIFFGPTIDDAQMFAITNGNAETVFDGITFSAKAERLAGGGILETTAPLKLVNCIFKNGTSNNALNGGGAIFAYTTGSFNISGCLFDTNTSKAAGGGAIDVEGNGTLIITNSKVSANKAAGAGAGINIRGSITATITETEISENAGGNLIANVAAGIHANTTSSVTITGCYVYNNHSSHVSSYSGGITVNGSGSVNIMNTRVIKNKGGSHGGGGIVIGSTGTANIVNSIVTNNGNNDGTYQGAGIFALNDNTVIKVINCVVAYNDCGGSNGKANGIKFGAGAQNELINTIVWGNTDCNDDKQVGGTYSVQGSAVQGLIMTQGVYELNISNIAINGPNFVSVAGTSGFNGYDAAANWDLSSISPCIDKGVIIEGVTPTKDILGYDRPRGLGNDIGAYEFFLKTIYVKTDGKDSNDGMSWASAKKTIEEALRFASSGDQIWIAKGTYSIPATQTLNKSVSIYASFAGTENSPAERRKSNINAAWFFNDQTEIVYLGQHFILSADDIRLDGLKMVGSTSSPITGFSEMNGAISINPHTNIHISGCFITGFWPYKGGSFGAGINIRGGSTTVENTLVQNNRSKLNGSGINIVTGNHIIRGCNISGNYNDEASGNGGGINIGNGVVSIEDTSIDSNYVINGTGVGGGISVLGGKTTIIRCKVSNNRAKTNAAGIYVENGTVLMQSSLISNNYLGTVVGTNSDAAFAGGGFYLINGNATLENCTIVNNHCGNGDGVVGGGICQRTAGSIIAKNCLVWGNISANTSSDISGTVTLTNCAVTGTTLLPPNINLDSVNTNATGPNFKLTSNSAGYNANWATTNWSLESNSICNDNGILISAITKDIIGVPVPQGAATDIGAYETAAIGGGNFLTFNNLEQEILSMTPVTTSPINSAISYYPSVADAEAGTNVIIFANLKPGKWRVKAVVVNDLVYGSETAYADLYINENFDVKIGQDILYVNLGKKEKYGETLVAGYGESWENPLSKKLLVKALDYANLKVCVSSGTYESIPTLMVPAGKTLEGGWLITNGVGTRDLASQSIFGDKKTIYPWEFKNPTIIKQSVEYQNAVIDLSGGIIDGLTVQNGRCGVSLRNNGKIYNSIITNNQGPAGATGELYKGIGVSVDSNSAGNLIESSFIYDNKHIGGGHQNHAAAGIGLNADATMFVAVKNSIIAKNKSQNGTGGMTTGKSSNPVILNCIFVNNESSADVTDTISSGGIGRHSNNNSNVRIENCTIVYNKTSATGSASYSGVSLGGDGSNFKNNIVWGNVGGVGQSSQTGIGCAIQGMGASVNLATTNEGVSGPNFFDITGSAGVGGYSFVSDWRITSVSPCLNKIEFSEATTADILGVNRQAVGGEKADIGAYELINTGSMYLTFHNVLQYKDNVSPVYTSPIESTISYYQNDSDALADLNELSGVPTNVGRYRVKAVVNAAVSGYPVTEEFADLIIIDNIPENKDNLYVVDINLIPYGQFSGDYGESWENPIAGALLQDAISKAKRKVFLSEGSFTVSSTLNIGAGKILEGGYNMATKKRDMLTTSEVSSIIGVIYPWELSKKSILTAKIELLPIVSVSGILDGVVVEPGVAGGSGATINAGATLANSVVKNSSKRGVYVNGVNSKILNSYITGNSTLGTDNGAGIYVNANSTITDCIISNNNGYIGGGLFLNAATTVKNCIIAANLARGDNGAAVKVSSGASTFVNCLIANNELNNAGGYAPGFDIAPSGCAITNCSFVMNKCLNATGAGGSAGTAIFARADLTITNSLFFGGDTLATNKAEIMRFGGVITLQNCAFGSLKINANNGIINNNNQILEALTAASFVSPATTAGTTGYNSKNNNWQLTAGSPCVDSGINVESVKSDIIGVARSIGSSYDVGAYEYFGINDSYLVLNNLNQVVGNVTDVYTTPIAAEITYYSDSTMDNAIDLPTAAGRYYVKAVVGTPIGIFNAVTQYADLVISGNYSIPTEQDNLYVSIEGKLGYGEFSSEGYGLSWDNPIVASQLTTAIANAKKKIYLAGGTYDVFSSISLPAGKTIEGGYDIVSKTRKKRTTSQVGNGEGLIYSWEFATQSILKAKNALAPIITVDGIADGINITGGRRGVNLGANATIQNSVIENNNGGGDGAGINVVGINAKILRCYIRNNSTGGNNFGGGVNVTQNNTLIESSIIQNNNNGGTDTANGGGGICVRGSGTSITNCLITNNTGNLGGGIIIWGSLSNVSIINCSIIKNSLNIGSNNAAQTSPGIGNFTNSNSIIIKNCIVKDNSILSASNTSIAIGNPGSNPIITNCLYDNNNVNQNPDASGNFNTDPGFIAPFAGIAGYTENITISKSIYDANWRLKNTSPCIDKGSSAGVPSTDIAGIARPLGTGYDIGAYEYVPEGSQYMTFYNLNQQEGYVIPVITSPSATNIQYYLNMEDAILGTGDTMLPTLPGMYVVKAIMFGNANFPDTEQYANLVINPTIPPSVEIEQGLDRIYVTPLGGSPYGTVTSTVLTGSSWQSALPATSLQDAINAVTANGEVWISFGTYYGAINSSGFTMRDGVSVFGGFYGNESSVTERKKHENGNAWEFVYETVFSGATPAGNSYSVVKFPGNAMSTTLLNGVTVENGYANLASNNNNSGGGIYLTREGVVDSCIIRKNRSLANGGGIFIAGGNIIRSSILENSADSSSAGGGIAVAANVETLIDSCFVINNSTSGNGGGINLAQSTTGNVMVKNSLIANNSGNWGAGICGEIAGAIHNSNFKVINCSIVRNLSVGNEDSRTGAQGVSMINTVIWGNAKIGKAIPTNQFYACSTLNCAFSAGNADGNPATGNVNIAENSNPGFKNPALISNAGDAWLSSWDYSISSMSSVLYNAGLSATDNSDIPNYDILDTIRPQGGKWDIGAYELIVDKIYPIYVFSNLLQQPTATPLPVTAVIQNMTIGFEDPSQNLTIEYAKIAADGIIGQYSTAVPSNIGAYKVKVVSPVTANFLEKIFILDMAIITDDETIFVTSNSEDVADTSAEIGSKENPLLAKFFINAVNLGKVKTINLLSGSSIETLNESSISDDSTIIIDRGVGALELVIDGSATASSTRAVNIAETSTIRTNSPTRRIFEIKNNVTFKNIIFDGGPEQRFSKEGAGLLFEGMNVTNIKLENCIIRNCSTTGNGGGLSAKNGVNIEITNSSFLLNYANNAAAINFIMGGNANITLRNTFISGNRSQFRNNVINSNQPIKAIGTIFDNNTGVALRIPSGVATEIINCTFVKNNRAIDAEASLGNAYVKVLNTIFWGNTSNFSVGGNGNYDESVYDVTYSAIESLPSQLVLNGEATGNNVALSSVNGGDQFYRGPIFKAPSNDIGVEGYKSNNSWRLTDYSESLLNKGLEDLALDTQIEYYTGLGATDIYGDSRIGIDQDGIQKIDIGAAEKGSRSSTPAVDVDVAYKGELFSWAVGMEIGVAYYNIIDAKTGKIVATIMATGENYYEIIVPEGMDLYLQIIDINGFSQDFAPGDKTIGRIIYNLKKGWNLIAIPFADTNISELANISGGTFWKFESGIYSPYSMETSSIEPMKGIWIYCEYQRQIELSGRKLSTSEVKLQTGWNLFGPSNNILSPINVEIVFGWNNQYEEIFKDSGVLIQGQGYWFFVTEKTIIKL